MTEYWIFRRSPKISRHMTQECDVPHFTHALRTADDLSLLDGEELVVQAKVVRGAVRRDTFHDNEFRQMIYPSEFFRKRPGNRWERQDDGDSGWHVELRYAG